MESEKLQEFERQQRAQLVEQLGEEFVARIDRTYGPTALDAYLAIANVLASSADDADHRGDPHRDSPELVDELFGNRPENPDG